MEEARLRKQVQKAKRWNLIVFGLFAAMAVLAAAALCIYQFQHTYSPEKWHSDRENRYQFVDDMLEKTQLMGKSESEVLKLQTWTETPPLSAASSRFPAKRR